MKTANRFLELKRGGEPSPPTAQQAGGLRRSGSSGSAFQARPLSSPPPAPPPTGRHNTCGADLLHTVAFDRSSAPINAIRNHPAKSKTAALYTRALKPQGRSVRPRGEKFSIGDPHSQFTARYTIEFFTAEGTAVKERSGRRSPQCTPEVMRGAVLEKQNRQKKLMEEASTWF